MHSAQQKNILRRASRVSKRAATLKRWGLGLFLVLALLAPILYTRGGANTRVYAAASNTLNFQARLLTGSGAIVPDGNYSVQFNLYNVASGGTTQWAETQGSIAVKAGYLSVYLGSVTPFPGTIDWSQQQWLTMNINGDGEMTPRLKLTAVPNALHANEADGLRSGSNVLTADNFAQLAPGTPQVINSALAALRLNQTGSGLLAQLQHNGSDVFTIANNGDLVSSGSGTFAGGNLTVGSTTQVGGITLSDGSSNTLTLQAGSQSGDLTFTLPTSYGANGDCIKGDGSGTLSFGACAGANSFVNGGNNFGAVAVLGTTDSNSVRFITNNTQAMLIDTSGNVRIGSSGTPSEKLDVNGAIRLGNTTNANAGTIRWTGTDFEGYNGSQWISLTSGAGNSPISVSFVSGLANVAANATGAVVETLLFTSATAVSNTAGVTGFTAPADGSFRTCLVKNNAAITGGTLNLRWRVNGVSIGSGACTMNSTTNRQAADVLDSNVVTFNAGDTIGIAFDTVGLAPTTNDFTVYWSVEYNSASTGGASTLQDAYNLSSTPAVITTADGKDLQVTLADTGTDGNFLVNIVSGSTGKFAVQDNGTDALSVTSSAITLSKAVTASAGLNLSGSGISNAGSITGVGSNLTATGGLTIATGSGGDLIFDSASNKLVLAATDTTLERTASGSFTIDLNDGLATTLVLNNSGSGAANLNLSDGGLQTAGTTRLTNGGVLQNITGLTVTSGGASISGNITLGGSSSDRLTVAGQMLGASPLVFQGATDNSFATTFSFTEPTANNTIIFPNASGTVVLDARAITAGTGLSGGGNLSSDRTLSLDINGLSSTTSINQTDYVAIYDGSGIKKIARSNFLQGLIGALQYRGTWDASTNTPSLSDITGSQGDEYAVSVGGTRNLGSGVINFIVGDFIIHNGTKWERAPSGSTVLSVFGRTGAITGQNGDYTASQITNAAAGNIAATTLQAAINELDTEKLGSLNGLTATSQSFVNDTNVTITSSGSTHTLGWSGQLSVTRGGTGVGSFTTNGVLYGNNTGTLQVTSAGTGGQLLLANSSGVPTFTTLSGDATLSDTGVLTIGADKVALGTDTTGGYIATLGTLTGLNVTGNSGEGSTPNLAVIYGSAAGTAVEGDTGLTITAGTNLSGGGGITLGAGGSVTLNIVADPTFGTSVTSPLFTNAGALTLSTTGVGNDLTLSSANKIILTGFDCSTFDNGGVLSVNSNGELVCDNDDGGAGGGSLSGSGTANRITFYTGSNTLGNSWLLQDTSTLMLDSGRDFDLISGNLQIAGTTVLSSGRALTNLTGISSSGTISFDSLNAGGLVKADSSGTLDIAIAGTDYEVPLTFNNGLTRTSNTVKLGGALTGLTDIALSGNDFIFSGSGNVGIGLGSPGYKLDVSGDIHASGNLIEKSVTFTPTTAGWYRIATNAFGSMGGTVRIKAAYDNSITDVEFQYNIGGYGVGGSVQQTRFSSYNNGAISDVRVSSDGLNNVYLDILVWTATSPLPITVYGFGPSQPTFESSPVVGAVAGSTNVNTLTLGHGFRTTQGAIFAQTGGNVGIGTSGTPSALLSIGGTTGNLTIDSSGNLATGGTTRLSAAGALQNITGLSVISGGASITGSIDLNGSANFNTNINTGTSTGTVTIGGGSAPLVINSTNFDISSAGALSGITTISASGAITAATSSNTINGLIINAGALSGITTINASGLATTVGLNAGTGLIQNTGGLTSTGSISLNNNASTSTTNIGTGTTSGQITIGGGSTPLVINSTAFDVSSTGALSGITTIGLSGAITGATATNTINGLVINSGALSAVTGITFTSGSLNLANGGITNAGSIAGVTSLSANQIYVPGTSGTAAQGFFTGSPTTRLGGFQSLDLSGNTYSFFGTNKYFNGTNWVDNGLGRVGSSFQIQNDAFTFYSFDTAANFTPRFTVASGGNVGVGVSGAPAGLLSVGGTTGNFQVNSAGGFTGTSGLIQVTGTGSALILDRTDGVIGSLKSGSAKVAFVYDNTGSFSISRDTRANISTGTGAGTDVLTALASGNVGIGDTNPLALFTVGTGSPFQVSSTGGITGVGLTIAGAITSINTSSNFAANINTGTSTGTVTIGGGSAPLVIDSTNFDVSSAGALSGITTIVTSGNITAGGTFVGNGQLGDTLAACTAGQYIGNGVKTDDGLITAGSCRNDASGLSDARLKKDVISVGSVLDKLESVRVVTFNFKVEEMPELNLDHGLQYGVIAQELEQIFPELVTQREDGYKEVNFKGLSFYTLKAVTELAAKVDAISPGAGSNEVKTDGVLRLSHDGVLQNINGLQLIAGGIDNNGGGIKNVGSILGATTINAQGLVLNATNSDNLLTLSKDGKGVFTVFNNGALGLQTDATNAFSVKNAAGVSIFAIDTQNGKVMLGAANTTKTVTFILDNRSTPDDPSGTNGASYYNGALGKFRCYQDNKWQDCLPAGDLTYPVASDNVTWRNQSADDEEFPGTPRITVSLTRAHEFRLNMRLTSEAAVGTVCRLQYAAKDSGPWNDLATDNDHDLVIDHTGTLKTDWLKIADNARSGDMIIRVMCKGGSRDIAPVIYGVSLQIR